MQQRQPEIERAERETEISVPERFKGGANRRIGEHDRQHCRQQQQHPGGRRPACEAEGGEPHTISKRGEHRIGKGAFVPGAIIAASIDEESWRKLHAAGAGACDIDDRPAPWPAGPLRPLPSDPAAPNPVDRRPRQDRSP